MSRADALLIGLCAALIGLAYVSLWSSPAPAAGVRVARAGETLAHYPLHVDRRFSVNGPLGETVLEIRDGAIRFVSSPCRHKICVRSGWHRRAGGVAACVPNRLSVVLDGGDDELDAMNY